MDFSRLSCISSISIECRQLINGVVVTFAFAVMASDVEEDRPLKSLNMMVTPLPCC
jgi:hypothetical protein